MRRWLGLLLVLLLAALLSGCTNPQKLGGKNRPTRIISVVSLSPSTTELLLTYAYDIPMLGRTQACNYPQGVERIEAVAGVKPNFERIAKLKPMAIAYDASLYNDAEIQQIKSLAKTTFEWKADSLDEYEANLKQLASVFACETRVSEGLDRIYQARNYNEVNAPTKKLKIAVLMGDGKAEWMATGVNSFLADVVRKSGGEPVGPESNKFVTINVEELLRLQPDMILCPGNARQVLQDPRLAPLPAVKNKLVVDINGDVMLRAGARVETLLKQLGEFIRSKA